MTETVGILSDVTNLDDDSPPHNNHCLARCFIRHFAGMRRSVHRTSSADWEEQRISVCHLIAADATHASLGES